VSGHHDGAQVAERAEQRWATLSVGIILVLVVVAAVGGIHQATMPQARVEAIDPSSLHLAGEFVESNLGSAPEPNGSVTVRAIGQQYSFVPSCIVVPAGTQITFRMTSADVVHGILIEGTNVNTMLVPGYIAELPARFSTPGDHLMPCHEFCGVGHAGMWGRVKVVEKAAFERMNAGHGRVTCVE
jgi:cytochrome c oxidase subunit II